MNEKSVSASDDEEDAVEARRDLARIYLPRRLRRADAEKVIKRSAAHLWAISTSLAVMRSIKVS